MSTDRRDYISYPTNRVVGTVADAAKAGAAIEALLRAGFDRKDVDILHGEEDLHRLDPTGAHHGFLAQFQRTLIRSLDLEEFKHLTHHVEDLRAGRFVIMVLTKRRPLRILAADILHQHGAEFVGFYGRWACEELHATAQTSPEAIPALFARAWNAPGPRRARVALRRGCRVRERQRPVLARPRVHTQGARGRAGRVSETIRSWQSTR